MGRGMLMAMIALPTVTALIAVVLIWSFEKSQRETRHREALTAAQKIFHEAQQAVEQKDLPLAVQKLKTYLADENAIKKAEARKLMAEIELVTSQTAATATLENMGDQEFQQFRQLQHYDDARIMPPGSCQDLGFQSDPRIARGGEKA